jgi:hypothetical protein
MTPDPEAAPPLAAGQIEIWKKIVDVQQHFNDLAKLGTPQDSMGGRSPLVARGDPSNSRPPGSQSVPRR